MADLTRLGLLYLVLLLSFLPGFVLVRRLRWNYLETVCASIGLSFILIYLVGFLLFLLRAGATAYAACSVCLLLPVLAERRRLWAFLTRKPVKRLLGGYAFLLLLGAVLLGLIRVNSGGRWAGDHWEHYQRARFFLGQLPAHPLFITLYQLPARPPFLNVVDAFYLKQFGDSHPLHQALYQVLGTLVYFPLVLLAGLMALKGHRRTTSIVTLLALTPFLWQNTTFPWTKLFSGFYVLVGLALYLRGWAKKDPRRIAAAFISLAAATLVHYSAGIYVLGLGLHSCYLLRRRIWNAWQFALALTLSVGLLATWLGWSLAVYGPAATFGSNTTTVDMQRMTVWENAVKTVWNLVYTLAPHPLHQSPHRFSVVFWQPSATGWWRDYWFCMVQSTLVLMMGCGGGLVVVWLLIRDLGFSRNAPVPARWFWRLFVLGSILAGVAVVGPPERYGLGHICLLPLALLGVVYLAIHFAALPAWLRGLLVAAAAIDWGFGVLLHYHVERFPPPFTPDGRVILSPFLLSTEAVSNAVGNKLFDAPHLGDLLAPVSGALLFVVFAVGVGLLYTLARTPDPGSRPGGRPAARRLFPAATLLACVYAWCLVDGLARESAVPGDAAAQQELDRAREVLHAQPYSPRASLNLGRLVYSRQQWKDAREFFITARMLDPFDLEIRYYLFLLQRNHQDPIWQADAAERVFTNPYDFQGWGLLAAGLAAMNLSEPSANDLARAVQVSGNREGVLEGVGDVLMGLKRPDLALRYYRAGASNPIAFAPVQPGLFQKISLATEQARRMLKAKGLSDADIEKTLGGE